MSNITKHFIALALMLFMLIFVDEAEAGVTVDLSHTVKTNFYPKISQVAFTLKNQ